MGKAKKGPKGGEGAPQKHLHSRISYLHQAAAYLATTRSPSNSKHEAAAGVLPSAASSKEHSSKLRNPQSRYLLNQLEGVSKKSQIRLGRDVKHSICRRCDTLMIPGRTSSQIVRNESTGGRKPWADIFEIQCSKCKAVKRFPIGSQIDGRSLKERRMLASNSETWKPELEEPPALPGKA